MHTKKINAGILTVAMLGAFMICSAAAGYCNGLRVLSMGGGWIALEDEDGQINPYDFGVNPAYLLRDYSGSWSRLTFGIDDQSGKLRRPFDPEDTRNLSAGAAGVIDLGERHVVKGSFCYRQLVYKGVAHSLELDQYNDPFYLTDQTTGKFTYYGPSMTVDYSLRLRPRLYVGGKLDYDIASGLKDVYTRPEIVHNYFKTHLGVLYEASGAWTIGFVARPFRMQNRTQFDQSDEGYDNLIIRLFGDGIYDIVATGTGTMREVATGMELSLQNFYMTERLQAGVLLSYGTEENEIEYAISNPDRFGFWQNDSYDARAVARYAFADLPLTVGLSGRYQTQDGWAKRPRYEDVVMYENPVDLVSAGGGMSYRFEQWRLLTSLEYEANMYDITVSDYGADEFRAADVVQNIARFGLEHELFGLHSIRAGFQYTDYLIDRWLKLPANSDEMRFSAGFRYRTSGWDFDITSGYALTTKESVDDEREDIFCMLWATRRIY